MIMCGCYLALSLLCLFYLYHHPNHIGVVVSSKDQTTDEGFFMDTIATNVMLTSTQINKNKRTATLYEIFKFRE